MLFPVQQVGCWLLDGKLLDTIYRDNQKLVNVPAVASDTENGNWSAVKTNISSSRNGAKNTQEGSLLLNSGALSRLNRVTWINQLDIGLCRQREEK
jgi:hypothetical protein